MSDVEIAGGLPDNAYRELAPGERYEPIVPAASSVPEITTRSIVFGLIMTAIFSAAAAYLALKLGQGIESAIPIANNKSRVLRRAQLPRPNGSAC